MGTPRSGAGAPRAPHRTPRDRHGGTPAKPSPRRRNSCALPPTLDRTAATVCGSSTGAGEEGSPCPRVSGTVPGRTTAHLARVASPTTRVAGFRMRLLRADSQRLESWSVRRPAWRVRVPPVSPDPRVGRPPTIPTQPICSTNARAMRTPRLFAMRRSGVRIPSAPPHGNPARPAQTRDVRRGFIVVTRRSRCRQYPLSTPGLEIARSSAGPSGPLRRPPQPKDGPNPPTPAPLPSARPSAQAAPTQPDEPDRRHAETPGTEPPWSSGGHRARRTLRSWFRPRPDSDHGLRIDAARVKGAFGVADAISQARPLTRTPPLRGGWVSGRGRGLVANCQDASGAFDDPIAHPASRCREYGPTAWSQQMREPPS